MDDIEKISLEQRELIGRSPIQLTSEQFERLLLTPQANIRTQSSVGVHGHKFGNPTPLGLIAFLLVQAPTACIQLGWGGSNAVANAVLIGPYYLLGGLGLIISGVMEWVVGNTFPSVVAITFGGNWLALATVADPAHGITLTFPDSTASPEYNKALMFYFAFWTFLTSVYFMTSLRSNAAFAGIFFNISFANGLNAAGYGELGNGNEIVANALFKAGGAFEFVVVCVTGYLFVALMLESVDMPFRLPVGEFLSHRNKAKLS
ncbi:GPR1/FUN34/yaaH family-domain-containing protein [Lentinula raphanica]|uniref:GPR1/FUN34/yaaH family-domain-containing protein n=1 Tax=Lentinula raphanica TaxID=153919 RepID=A0AA38P820_9AGAR|nr:GPR1/FUN34/yaaH family-domain-containing protein [Lentinula raphanica]KAJ3969702.1 GPR1/FUN34/yaaH family-domain-containing protein [Lentinula raphanica]